MVLDLFDTYNDIKQLRVTEKEINKWYYPKNPNKLYGDISEEAKDTFVSLSKGFLLWYGIIIISLFNELELQTLTYLLYAIFIPMGLAALLFSRNLLFSWVDIDVNVLLYKNNDEAEETTEKEEFPAKELDFDIPDASNIMDDENP